MGYYPYKCKEHPEAEVLHTWDEDYKSKDCKAIIRNERFSCEICGKLLAKNQQESSCQEG